MATVKDYMLFSYNLLGRYVRDYEKNFRGMAVDLEKSRINAILPEYVSTIFLTTIISFFLFLPLDHLLFSLFMPDSPAAVVAFTVVFATFGLTGATFMVLYYYPKFVIAEQKRSIDGALPYATAHMSTIAGTGAPPISMFKVLVGFREFGELSNECGDIVRDVDLLGYDLLTALERTARRSPSDKFRDLLWGIITTIRSGGDLRTFLIEKSTDLLEEHRRTIREYTNTVSLFSEVYTTMMIAAPLLVVIMAATMSIIGGKGLPVTPAAIMMLTIYVMVPVGSILSILYLKGAKPQEL